MRRQGDLLIVKVKKIPKDGVKQKNRVLAEGEVTGHFHELDLGEVYEQDGILYFRIDGDNPANLNHPEHKTIVFEPGEYKVIRQREYEPRSKGWRNVSD